MTQDHCPLCKSPRRQRSPASHRFLFAAIREAFKHWPEEHVFQPRDAEHLRAWLLIEANWYDEMDVPSLDRDGLDRLIPVMKFFSHGRSDFRLLQTPTGVKIRRPRSIAYAATDRAQFMAVAAVVLEIIEQVIGVPADVLVREHVRDAA